MIKLWHWFDNLTEARKLLLLFLFALLIRVIGIDYGYWFGDERINYAAKVLTGQLIPGDHYYPPLLNYLTAVCFVVLYVFGRLFGFWYDLAGFREQYFTDPTSFYITARLFICIISAAVVPLFYLIVRELGFSKCHALLASFFGIFIPGLVLLSHISKSDVPLAVCIVLVFYTAIKKLKNPKAVLNDFWMGLSIALALSFKHSYIFIFFPFYFGFLITLYLDKRDIGLLVRACSITGMFTIILWLIFNIGIVFDFQNFLDYQKIQAVMSVRENKTFIDGFLKWWSIVADPSFGINAIVVILFLVFPLSLWQQNLLSTKHKHLLFTLWVSLFIGSLLVIYLSGSRQQSGLWIPYMVSMELLVVIGLIIALQSHIKVKFLVSALLLVSASLYSIYGTTVIIKQAIAKPIVYEVEALVRENFSIDEKILTIFRFKAPQTKLMRDEEKARDKRIAQKYNVVLPERTSESKTFIEQANAINYRNMPMALHGLEHLDDDEALGGEIKPYAWPLQKEEWQLDYWIDRGFSIIVLADHQDSLYKSTVPIVRAFYHEVKDYCQLVKYFPAVKPLFIEFSATVYQCEK